MDIATVAYRDSVALWEQQKAYQKQYLQTDLLTRIAGSCMSVDDVFVIKGSLIWVVFVMYE